MWLSHSHCTVFSLQFPLGQAPLWQNMKYKCLFCLKANLLHRRLKLPLYLLFKDIVTNVRCQVKCVPEFPRFQDTMTTVIPAIVRTDTECWGSGSRVSKIGLWLVDNSTTLLTCCWGWSTLPALSDIINIYIKKYLNFKGCTSTPKQIEQNQQCNKIT